MRRRRRSRATVELIRPESGQGLRRSARPEARSRAVAERGLLRRQPQRVDAASDRRAADPASGDGSQIYTPPKTPGASSSRPRHRRKRRPPRSNKQASASAMPPNSQAQSTLTYRQPAQANAAVGPVNWRNAIKEVGRVASLAADSRASTSTVLPRREGLRAGRSAVVRVAMVRLG